MSAWVVSKSHIDVLVSALGAFKVTHSLGRNPDEIGRALWRENVASVSFRYDLPNRDDDRRDELKGYEADIAAYKFRELHELKPGAVAKLAHCFDYQSCEHDAWEDSPSKAAITRLLDRLTHSLPGYEAAPWGVTEKELPQVCNPAMVSLSSLIPDGRGPVRRLRR